MISSVIFFETVYVLLKSPEIASKPYSCWRSIKTSSLKMMMGIREWARIPIFISAPVCFSDRTFSDVTWYLEDFWKRNIKDTKIHIVKDMLVGKLFSLNSSSK
jgi:hypothetical protein